MTRYFIQIECANVPAELAGAPLSLEIISETGAAKRTLLELGGASIEHDVNSAGSYLVRTTLPSGRVMSAAATVPERLPNSSTSSTTIVLDMKEADAATDFWREAESLLKIAAAVQAHAGRKIGENVPPWLVDRTRELLNRAWSNVAGLAESALAGLRKRLTKVAEGDGKRSTGDAVSGSSAKVPPREPVRTVDENYRWGTFLEWSSVGRPTSQISLQLGGDGRLGSLGELHAPDAVAGGGPFFIEVAEVDRLRLAREDRRIPDSEGRADRVTSLIVWLPGLRKTPAMITSASSGSDYRSGSSLTAFPYPEDPISSALFEYLRHGSIEEARMGLNSLVGALEREEAGADPNRGILAGYVLYKLRHGYANELIPRLCKQHPSLSDPHILQCAQLIALGKQEEAAAPMATAIRCGLPIYTEGVRMLRDNSSYLRDLLPDDPALEEAARKVRNVAAAANLESTLTCLRLGSSLKAEFHGA